MGTRAPGGPREAVAGPPPLRGSLLALLYSLSGVGAFSHPITLIAASGDTETLDALVDTGAMFSVIPAPVLERLAVRPFRTMPVRFANGPTEQWLLGEVEAELDGQRMPILCLFGSPAAPPLIGAHALGAFLLSVDPVEQKLVPKEAYLM